MNFQKERERINSTAILLDIEKVRADVHQILEKGHPGGLSTGWAVMDNYFKFAPVGQLNLVTGTPGAGKSEWLDSLALNMAVLHKWRIFVYSPENYPASYHLQKLAEKLIGKPFFGHDYGVDSMSKDELDKALDFLRGHFTFTDCHVNNATVDQILNSIFDECLEKEVQMAVIDPWNKLESQKPAGMSNTDYIGKALTRIQMFSRQRGISFWIVAHPSKPMRLKDASIASVTLYDVSDSANWFNMIDNGFILSRNWEDKVGYNYKSTLKIAKIKDRRYGRCKELDFQFYPATGRFEALAPKDRSDTEHAVRRWNQVDGSRTPGGE